MKKNSTEEAMTFILRSRPSLHPSLSFYIVKNAPIDDIIIMNVRSIFVIIVIDEHRDTEYPTVLTGIIKVGDFNHSGGYCYKLFSSLTCAYHAFTFSFIYDQHAFYSRLTCLPTYVYLPYVLHVFASRQTPVLYLFKSVVEHLYSLAIH